MSHALQIPLRLKVALLLSFFPCALLYPWRYPVPEVIALAAWIGAFPSFFGLASLVLLPLFASEAYAYIAYNLFCVVATLATALAAAKRLRNNPDSGMALHRWVRFCMFVSLCLATWQAMDGLAWSRIFPDMVAIGDGRGGGLRTEPSLLAALLAVYLALIVCRLDGGNETGPGRARGPLVTEAILVGVWAVGITRSASVAVVLLCFVPVIGWRLKYLVGASSAGIGAVAFVFWTRVQEGLSGADGSLAYLITSGVQSWRNVPDILILLNPREYLLPGFSADTREKINDLASAWDPQYAWLENTYSTFSASASTVGVVATACLLAGGLFLGLRRLSGTRLQITWTMLYIAAWFILPKYEASGWIALALLVALPCRALTCLHPEHADSGLGREFAQ